MIKILNGNLEDELKEDAIIDFYADWCGPCRMLAPVLEEVSGEIKENIIKVNVDNNRDLAVKYGVMSIPTLVLIRNQKEIKRNTGFLNKEEIKKFLS